MKNQIYKALVRYTLLNAMRDMLLIGLGVLIILATLLSIFLGSTNLIEQTAATIVYASYTIRMISVLGIILFISFQVQRAYENKEIDLLLSKPISRAGFLLAYFWSFMILSLVITLFASGLILVVQLINSHSILWYAQLIWSVSLYIELLLVSSFTLFVCLVTERAVFSSMVATAFYLMSRLIGFFLIMAHNPMLPSTPYLSASTSSFLILLMSVFFPRLDMLTKSEWLIYDIHNYHEVAWCALAIILYIPLLLSATLYDLKRKQF